MTTDARDYTGYSREAFERTIPEMMEPLQDQPPLMAALRSEHRQLVRIMELFRDQLNAIESGELIDTHVVYELMYYMVTVPDRFHHPREDVIYQRVAELDGKAADNVDTLQREHDAMAAEARGVLQTIEDWRQGDVDGIVVVNAGRAYLARVYEHMNQEELVVFPHIEKVLTEADWRELAAEDSLRPERDPVFGGRIDREFRNLARKLRRDVRQRVELGVVAEWVAVEALMESVELVSMAVDDSRAAAGDRLKQAFGEAREMFKDKPAAGLVLCPLNNTRHSFVLIGELLDISRDTARDLSRVNQERRDRIRLLGGSRS